MSSLSASSRPARYAPSLHQCAPPLWTVCILLYEPALIFADSYHAISQHLVTVVLRPGLDMEGEGNMDIDVGLEDSGCEVGERWAQGKLHCDWYPPVVKPTHPHHLAMKPFVLALIFPMIREHAGSEHACSMLRATLNTSQTLVREFEGLYRDADRKRTLAESELTWWKRQCECQSHRWRRGWVAALSPE